MLKLIAINDVQPGMVIVRVSQQHGPVKIKKSGLVTSVDMVQGLAEMGVSEVEIDTDQTVELEAQETTSSTTQTQALLQGQYDRQGHYDNQLADQFNRNLFLPSVQGIPSLWAVYLRQGFVITLTALVGLAIGFGAANPNFFFSGAKQETQDLVASPNTEASSMELSKVDIEQPDPVVEKPVVEQPKEDTPVIASAQPAQTQAVAQSEPTDNQEDDLGEAQVVGAPPTDEMAAVSPELLRRFNQAIEELDNEPQYEREEPVLTVRNDIQRVDQLPVRLMTSLPSMTFSAHMYATRESDRWVRVNGLRLQEGDVISDKVQIVAIEPQRVVLSYQNELFTMAALTDW